MPRSNPQQVRAQGQSILQGRGYANDEKYPLGGEGLILRQPTTRDRFAADFSIAK